MTRAEAPAGIRRLIDGWVAAIRAQDLDAVMSFYAPDSTDVAAPLRFAGMALKRHAWAEFFETHSGEIDFEVTDLKVTRQGNVACLRSLNHVSSKRPDGKSSDLWVRWTACLRKFSGEWLVVHDHVSVPADLENMRAVSSPLP
jgi:uncharacterized protein (TIGR02246 family)